MTISRRDDWSRDDSLAPGTDERGMTIWTGDKSSRGDGDKQSRDDSFTSEVYGHAVTV